MCDVDGDYAEVWTSKTRRARKAHRCYECGAQIPVGEDYRHVTCLYDGEWSGMRTHLACEELRDFIEEVVCGGHGQIFHGGLADEIFDAGSYMDGVDHGAWKEAELDTPNPLADVFDEIRAHYRALEVSQ